MIILDYGHGENTKGKRCGELLEWQFNRNIGRFLELELSSRNIDYHVLVPEKRDIPLSTRVQRSKNIKHDLLISIHGNAFTSEKVRGVETWYHSQGGKIVAGIFQRHIIKRTGWVNRGIKKGNFYILKHTPQIAILTENGFYTNDTERLLMLDEYWQLEIAMAHVDAIQEFLKLKL